MVNKAVTWAWEQNLPSPTHKLVLVCLADHADEALSCFPGQKKLAEECNCSVSTIRRVLKDLQEWGFFTKEERRRSDGYKTSDRYYLQGVPEKLDRKTSGVNLTGEISDTSAVKYGTSQRSNTTSSPSTGGHALTVREPSEESSEVKNEKNEKVSGKRGSRLPADFAVTAPMREWAAEYAPSVNLETQTEMFIDYWNGIPGVRGLKSDWVGAWRNWMRKDHSWSVKNGWKPEEPIHRFGSSDVA